MDRKSDHYVKLYKSVIERPVIYGLTLQGETRKMLISQKLKVDQCIKKTLESVGQNCSYIEKL